MAEFRGSLVIYVIATFRLRPGALEPFVEAAYALIDVARRDPGCIYYDLHASVTDPDRVMCFEQWQDRPAFDHHLATPAVTAFNTAIEGLVLSSKVEIIHPDRIETP
ncbi:putative quinol monooxygenase [Devosia ginsengisoli]|uniref:putative quinol monooxygenase n=1 Tax=Devosia ginsengisoli TaxID=400770 RepID=UPI0026EC3B3D|nr:antibiotic biosynthesis monooxygenase family protein [Devosia ginsengisoli]MCR6673971.1 antibiotic biosynthesis monooxygenase [Devosia ginsengisoli]